MSIINRFNQRKAQTDADPSEPTTPEESVPDTNIPQKPSYPPEKVEQALSSGDALIGKYFDQLALMIEHNAGVAQEIGQVHRQRFYGHYIDRVKQIKAEFEAELNPEGGYAGKNSIWNKKQNRPWYDGP